MAGQGATIRRIASLLRQNDWSVVYVCIPNSPHVGVVPIPTPNGATEQRYPDILAFKGHVVKLIEVEIAMDQDTAQHTIERFAEQCRSLRSPALYSSWRARVHELTGYALPTEPDIKCELITCSALAARFGSHSARLIEAGISVCAESDYSP